MAEEVERYNTRSGKELAPRTRGVRGQLERSWVKHRLIRDFAIGELKGYQLAEQYGVSVTAISMFKKRHAHEIEDIRNNLADEYAGVWVAKKLERIRAYQEAAQKMAGGETTRSAEVLVQILKAVAEELGDLPARQQVTVNTGEVTYAVVGINPDDLT